MPSISISVHETGALLQYEPSDDMTLGTLKEFIAAEIGSPASAIQLFRDGNVLRNDAHSLKDIGIQDHDVISARISSPTHPQRSGPASTSQPPQTQLNRQADLLRQQILGNERLASQVRSEAPDLANAINDPTLFRQRFAEQLARIQGMQQQQADALAALDDDVTAENQEKIAEHIRQQNVEQQYADVMMENPEFFAKVTMLYINVQVNGNPVKAFVDSGAQATIMSPSCADACNVTRLIDKRFAGVAHGVGTAKILGRVHRADMIVGDVELPCSFTVMEGKDVDLLFGLDMLRRYQACIDLEKNVLRFKGGGEVPFLPESEIPRAFEEARTNEPTIEGPDGAQIGAESGVVKSTPSASASGGASATAAGPSSAPQQSGLPGSGGAGSKASASSSSSQSTMRTTQPAPPTTTSGALPFSESDVNLLVDMGATRKQAIEALNIYGGNVDMAASHILGL